MLIRILTRGPRMHIRRSGTLDFAVYDIHMYFIKIILNMTDGVSGH
jgi:hypothetical protein